MKTRLLLIALLADVMYWRRGGLSEPVTGVADPRLPFHQSRSGILNTNKQPPTTS